MLLLIKNYFYFYKKNSLQIQLIHIKYKQKTIQYESNYTMEVLHN
jgi:hypothetical protein